MSTPENPGPAGDWQASDWQASDWQASDWQASNQWPPPAAPVSRTARWPWVVGAISLALALIGGVGGLVALRVLSGGGVQPESVLPANTFAFAKLDLDPSAGQKIAAVRFMHALPSVGKSFGDKKEPKQSIFDAISGTGGLPKDTSYARDIKPWLGDRVAVAARPPLISDDQPDVLVVLQSTNDQKARAGLAKLAKDSDQKMGVAFSHGYAIIAEKQEIADRAVADTARASLHESATFVADMKLLGEEGVSAGWADLDQIAKMAGSALGMQAGLIGPQAQGRFSYAVRFIDGGAEMIVKERGANSPAGTPAVGLAALADLPSSTAAAVTFTGIDKAVDQIWAAVRKQLNPTELDDLLASAQENFGLALPGDVKTLIGTDVLLSLDSAGLSDGQPRLGARSHTSPADAGRVLTRLRAALGGDQSDLPIQWSELSDGIVVANDPAYLPMLTKASGAKLGDQRDFRDALPEVGGSAMSAYVSLREIGDALQQRAGSDTERAWLKTFRALGVTARVGGNVTTVRVRLLLR